MLLFHPGWPFSSRQLDLRAVAEVDWQLARIREVFQDCAARAGATPLQGTNRYSGVGTQPALRTSLGLVVYVANGASITPNGKGHVAI